VQAGSRTLGRLEAGAPVRVAVETHVREDAIRLYGFLTEDERGWFVQLMTIPGVGAKVALGVLDALAPAALADAVALQDKTAVARANGVGPKLAQRIVQELSGKVPGRTFHGGAGEPGPASGAAVVVASPARNEAVSALVNLGIDQSSAARAVAMAGKVLGPDPEAPALIRAALKEVAR
jgi:Holliday junction DNA helicase RuvA